MTNSSVLLGKRKRHQLLNQQNENIHSPNNNDGNNIYINEDTENIDDSITTTISTPTPITDQSIVGNIPFIQLTENNFPELWKEVFSYLKLSHLFELSVVCKAFNTLIHHHPTWNQILENIPALKKLMINYNNNNSESQIDAMKIITQKRKQICEGCFKWMNRDGARSVLPLYVIHEHGKIYLCLSCRKKYYMDYCDDIEDNEFEQIYNVHENYIPKYIAENYYLLGEKDLEPLHRFETRNPHGRGLHYLQLYHYTDIVMIAKQKYGGSVGFLAQLEKISKKRDYQSQLKDGNI